MWSNMEDREEVHEMVQTGTFDIFFGIEHKMKKEKWRSTSTTKRSKDGDLQLTLQESPMRMQAVKIASSHREGFIAIDNNLGAVIGKEERTVESIPGNEGRIAKAWVSVRGGMWSFRMLDPQQWSNRRGPPKQPMANCL